MKQKQEVADGESMHQYRRADDPQRLAEEMTTTMKSIVMMVMMMLTMKKTMKMQVVTTKKWVRGTSTKMMEREVEMMTT